jgi:chromosome condensin MukBEF MukE localization factor
LIERIKREKEIDTAKFRDQDQKALDKLITLGMVTSFLDNTVSVSPIGEQVLRFNIPFLTALYNLFLPIKKHIGT